jgi:Concanavalin A-like lectin/glucanases superfamily/Secretion system C-terminal sorting domain
MGLGQIGGDVWHHVAITYNGSLVSIYLDGTLNASSQKNLNTQLSEVIFGRSPMTHPTPYYYDGLLDDCGIWNRVLTQEEINALYTSTTAGIRINQASSGLSIFPNPAQNKITLSGSSEDAGKSYRIFDSKGILKLAGKVEGGRQEIKLHGFSSGIYSLLMEGGAARLLMVQNP